jgi:glycopeptide antibiotics resistance protein
MLLVRTIHAFGLIILLIMQVFFFIKKLPVRRNLLYTALLIYIVLVFGVTLFPIPIRRRFGNDLEYYFIPFESLKVDFRNSAYAVRNLLGNIIMFMPLGILLPLLMRKRNFWRILLISAASAVFVEFMQFLIGVFVGYHYRQVSIDDVILNLAGAILGWLIYKIIRRLIPNFVKRYEE